MRSPISTAALLLLALASLSLAAAATSPAFSVENGELVVEVPENTAIKVAYVDGNGNRIGDPQAIATMADVAQMISQQAQINEDRFSALTARIEQNVTAVLDRMDENFITQETAYDDLVDLINDKADKSALLTADDVTAAVEAMVGSDNALAAALATKLDASQAFTREDAISVVDDLVNGAVGEGEGDTLRGTLDSLQARIETLEDAVEDSCGRHCRAGEFVKTACTETDPTVCEACPQEQFSLGGLPNSCIACKTCKATEYAMSPCTASTDRACAACGVCGDGTFEKTPCSATQNTDCQTCDACDQEGQFLATECSAKADAVCGACTQCADDEDVAVPCGGKQDTICVKKNFGFRAILTNNVGVTSTGSRVLAGSNMWLSSASTVPSLFQNGNYFDNTGVFTVPITGYYFIAAQVRLDNIDSRYIRLIASISGADPHQIHSIRGNALAPFSSITISGVARLERGNTLRLIVHSETDGDYIVQRESGFSAYRLPATEGMFGNIQATYETTGVGWHEVGPFDVSSRAMRFTLPSAAVVSEDKRSYLAQEDGIFLVSSLLRLDGVTSRNMRSAIALDGQHDPDTLHSIEQGLPTNYVTMHVTGLIQATKGQRISAAVNSPDDLSYSVYRESSFSLLRLQTPMAFAADLAATTQIRTEDYVTVQNWRTTGSPGVFDTTNGAFDGASGVFTAPVDGIYYTACNIRIDSADNARFLRVILDISSDTADKQRNGLHVIKSNAPAYYSTNPSGVMRMKTGDKVSVVLEADEENFYRVQQESGFFVALLHEE